MLIHEIPLRDIEGWCVVCYECG